MEYHDIETVYRFNGNIYEFKDDAEQAQRFDSIKQNLMTVLNVSTDSSFDEFWSAFIRNDKAIELTRTIMV